MKGSRWRESSRLSILADERWRKGCRRRLRVQIQMGRVGTGPHGSRAASSARLEDGGIGVETAKETFENGPLLLAESEAEIARLDAAVHHARQMQAAIEVAVEEELTGARGEGNVAGIERARSLRLLHNGKTSCTCTRRSMGKENEALRRTWQNLDKFLIKEEATVCQKANAGSAGSAESLSLSVVCVVRMHIGFYVYM
jgi:hypothetical protein